MTASDDDAYTAYVSAKMQWLRGVAYLLCQDWHRADDLGQATITKLYVNWRRASQVANIDGYVRTILVNTYLSEQRSPWWKRVVPQHKDPTSVAPAGDLEAVLDLREALKSLPPRQRATVVLRYYDELSVQEAAEVLGCSVGNVKSQTSRALDTLRRILADRPADPAGGPPADPPMAVLHNGSASLLRDRLSHPEGRRS